MDVIQFQPGFRCISFGHQFIQTFNSSGSVWQAHTKHMKRTYTQGVERVSLLIQSLIRHTMMNSKAASHVFLLYNAQNILLLRARAYNFLTGAAIAQRLTIF